MKTILNRVQWSLLLLLAGVFPAQAFYNSTTGRWLSRDPIEERGGPNLYAFLGNNPEGFCDPLGLEGVQIFTSEEDAKPCPLFDGNMRLVGRAPDIRGPRYFCTYRGTSDPKSEIRETGESQVIYEWDKSSFICKCKKRTLFFGTLGKLFVTGSKWLPTNI